ncbi:MAG TPA: cupin domain-containing protein [Actinomycetota bacterium]|nr:cupin domain-containing protein [Actinomycetota bacterium]
MGGLRVIKPSDRIVDDPASIMVRETAASAATVGAERLWMGFVRLGPGLLSPVHHHGEAESCIYLLSGRARFYAGDALGDVLDAEAGDFIWVPPHAVHVEQNVSTDEPALAVVARSVQDNPVVNVEAPEGWAPIA